MSALIQLGLSRPEAEPAAIDSGRAAVSVDAQTWLGRFKTVYLTERQLPGNALIVDSAIEDSVPV